MRYKICLGMVLLFGSLSAQEPLSQRRIEELFQQGTYLISSGNYGAARTALAEYLLASSPADHRRGEASYYLAFAALNLGHRDGEKLMDEFIASNPSHPKASTAYYDLALFFYESGNYPRAINYFSKIRFTALTQQQQAEGHFKFGYAQFNQKKFEPALAEFGFLKAITSPFSPAANYYAGYIEYSQGKYEEALTDFRRAGTSGSYSRAVPHMIVSCLYKQGKYDELLTYTSSLTNRQDLNNAGEIALLEAEARYFKGDFKAAAAAYEGYFTGASNLSSGALFRAGYANYITGNNARGISLLEQAAAAKDTISYYASYYLGISLLKSGNKASALNAFQYAREVPSDNGLEEEAAFQTAKVAYDLGKSERAIDDMEKFLRDYPRSSHVVEIKELLAQAYVNGNNYHKALNYIESMAEMNSTMKQAYQKAAWLMGSELFNKEKYPEALSWFSKSLDHPMVPAIAAQAAFWAGECESNLGHVDQANTYYARVISNSAADKELISRSHYGAGYAYFNTKDYAKALPHFEAMSRANTSATSSSPWITDGLTRLADCYYALKKYDLAKTTYQRVRLAGTTEPDYVLLQSGVIAGIRQSYAEAAQTLSELIAKYERSPYRNEAIYQKGMFEIESGNYAGATETFGILIREGQPGKYLPYAYARRAVCHFNLKNNARVVEDYQELIRLFPSHPLAQDVLVPLQEALTALNRADEFDKYLAIVKASSSDRKGLDNLEFETAKKYYFSQDYKRSIPALQTFLATYPESSWRLEAVYYLGESYYRTQDYPAAIRTHSPLLQQTGFANYSRVLARVAEMEAKLGNFKESIVHYKTLERVASTKKELASAWLGLMDGFYELKSYDSALRYATAIVEKGGTQPGSVNKASLYMGKIALAKGDVDNALDGFLNTLNAAQDVYGAEAKYLIGEIYHQQKNYKRCYETLLELNRDFNAYEYWVGRSFLLLAENYYVQGNVFQTGATLRSLADFPLAEIRDKAKARLEEIERKELATKALNQPDSTENK